MQHPATDERGQGKTAAKRRLLRAGHRSLNLSAEMMPNLGRNDPCHCGSGKKYKKCHLAQDEAAHLAEAPLREDRFEAGSPDGCDPGFVLPPDLAPPVPLPSGKSPAEIIRQMKNSPLLDKDPELRAMAKEYEQMLEQFELQNELEGVFAELEPYEAEYQKLAGDNEAFLERAEHLFQEEPFKPLAFTADEVATAFSQAGYTPQSEPTEKMREPIAKSLLLLATKERRKSMTQKLLAVLVRYVKEGRHLDARIIAYAAQVTTECPDEPNIFLVQMFFSGYLAGVKQQNELQRTALREAGLDIKPGMELEQIDEWLKAAQENPELENRLAQLIESNPELKMPALKNKLPDELAVRATMLLSREDAGFLLLEPEEIEPFMPFLLGKMQEMNTKYGLVEGGPPLPRETQQQAFAEVYLPAMREVVGKIFTPKRIAELVEQLKEYRKNLLAAREQEGFLLVCDMIQYVSTEDEPGLNVFLLNLCARSIHGDPPPQP
jgi:hypothetical protein